jgi:hypothetical protein
MSSDNSVGGIAEVHMPSLSGSDYWSVRQFFSNRLQCDTELLFVINIQHDNARDFPTDNGNTAIASVLPPLRNFFKHWASLLKLSPTFQRWSL